MFPFINLLAVQRVGVSEDVATQVALVNVHMFAAKNGVGPQFQIRYPRITWRWREKERERDIESRRCRSENHVPPLHISPFRNSGLQRFGANCRCRITDPNWLGFSTKQDR